MRFEQAEIAALKKAPGRRSVTFQKGGRVLREGVGMKFASIAQHHDIWPAVWLCEVLQVYRSGFRGSLNKLASSHAVVDERLLRKIAKSFQLSDRTYRARRVWQDVLADNFACGLHRVKRVMRVNGL